MTITSSSPSLLEAPASSPFVAAADWVTGTLLGSVAVSLCVIAVAFVGLRMMTGHLSARDGLRVVIACFVLLGASTIAAGLRGAAEQASPPAAVLPTLPQGSPAPSPLPPADYDPYAGASLRR